jgi:Spx/MgsR family transcriptional regulator
MNLKETHAGIVSGPPSPLLRCGKMPRMTITLYGIPNCDTVKKARAWLTEHGLAHAFHDFKKAGVPPDLLQQWVDALGWEVLLNRKGTTWRQLDEATRLEITDAASAMRLMRGQPSVIKRPVVAWPDGLTVGFDAAAWAVRPGTGAAPDA